MVFGSNKLQNDIFCLTEEKNYFQGKFLEQVSEIANLKEELKKAKQEVSKLRAELMNQNGGSMVSSVYCEGSESAPQTLLHAKERIQRPEIREADTDDDDASSLTSEGNALSTIPTEDNSEAPEMNPNEDEELSIKNVEDDDDNNSAKDIRQSAEKLLQWASYRELNAHERTSRTGSTVVTDHSSVASPSIPKTIEPLPQSAEVEE